MTEPLKVLNFVPTDGTLKGSVWHLIFLESSLTTPKEEIREKLFYYVIAYSTI